MLNSYQLPEDRRCQVCDARMPDPAGWLCPSCGASQTPARRAGGIRGFLGEVNQLKPFVTFAVVLIVVVVAMFAAGWGHCGGRDDAAVAGGR